MLFAAYGIGYGCRASMQNNEEELDLIVEATCGVLLFLYATLLVAWKYRGHKCCRSCCIYDRNRFDFDANVVMNSVSKRNAYVETNPFRMNSGEKKIDLISVGYKAQKDKLVDDNV